MKINFIILLCFFSLTSHSQTSEEFVKNGYDKYNNLNFDGALKDFNNAIKLSPNESDYYIIRGMVKKQLKDYNGSLTDYNKALSLNPKNADAYCSRGITKTFLDDVDGACADFNKCKELGRKGASDLIKKFCNKTSLVSQTDTSSKNDFIKGGFYINKKYKFRVHFIDSWKLDKGSDFDNVVVRSTQPDSGKTIGVIIIDYPNQKMKDKILTEKEKQDIIESLKLQGITPTNFKVERGWLNNFPANIMTYNFIKRDDTYEIPFMVKQISCTTDGVMYSLSISMPSAFYTEEEENRIYKVIASFYFVKNQF
jgi:tetratricopeptide (TPR) repeat protein